MHFEGTIDVPVAPSRFYAFVTAPEKIISILPEVEESRITDRDHFFVKANVGMSYIKGTVSMNFEFAEKRKDSFVKMVGSGQGVQSSIDLTMEIALEASTSGTRASWKADAKVGGLLASVGNRLLNAAAEKYINQMTEELRKKASG
jgi:uncharacterized protein